jgi:hypothetical protein
LSKIPRRRRVEVFFGKKSVMQDGARSISTMIYKNMNFLLCFPHPVACLGLVTPTQLLLYQDHEFFRYIGDILEPLFF